MPNILFTTFCNRRCPYCFALDAMEDADSRELSLRELIDLADMIVASGTLNTGVLGGEPTLHPRFCEFISYLLARRIRLTIFTNGLCSDKTQEQIAALPHGELYRFVVNVNPPGVDSEENRLRQERFVCRFAKQCHLSLNVYQADINPLFLADLARRAGLRSGRIRIGLAQPIVGERNRFLPVEYYRQVAEGIVALAEAVFDIDMVVSLDCGFPLCAFTDAQLGRLRRAKALTKFVCGIAADIGPRRQAWCCFPLAKQTRRTLEKYPDLIQLRRQFLETNKAFRKGDRKGIFEECNTCKYREHHVCEGGCVAHLIAADAIGGNNRHPNSSTAVASASVEAS